MKHFFIVTALVAATALPAYAVNYTAPEDTSKTVNKKAEKKKDAPKEEEMVLEEIQIQGKVDKPGVIIMPKRVEPEMKKIELERNFSKEIKQGVGEIPKPKKELRNLDRVKSIKKTLKRKRK